MKELKDYSGSFVPNLEYENLSKETLIKLVKEANRALIAMDGFYQTKLFREFGNEKADAIAREVWREDYTKRIIPRIIKALNIQGNDLEALMKFWQFDPSMGKGLLTSDVQLSEDKKRGTWTVTNCPALLFMEREGKGREDLACNVLEPEAIQAYADVINPKIKIKPLVTPPRKSPDVAPHCKWEFVFED